MRGLELAAKAAAEEYGEDWDKLPDLNPVANGEPDRRQYLEMMRAGLVALRDAEDLASLVAGKVALFCCTEDPELEHARACWHAMIDALMAAEPPLTVSQPLRPSADG